MMSRTVYALFVGINDYLAPMSPLRGCVNDVTHMAALLEARVTGANDRFAPLLLTDAQATRQGIIDAWRSHLGQAGPQDVALFHYSGHGSQEHAPPEFAHLEPDGLNETLVCRDSRLPGGWDLADKELAQLIAEVARNSPHLAVILDCCHSGSGTRDSDEMTPRQQMVDGRTRPIGTYIVTPEQATALVGSNPVTSAAAMPWASIASGRHILLAACRPEEKAKETMLGNEHRGAFSYFLQDTLQSTGVILSYRDLMQRASALLRGRGIDQMPQLEATDPDDLNQPFLGGAIRAAPPYFTLRSDKQFGWVIDGGAVHGVPQPSNSESTQLALFSFDTDLGGLRSLVNAIGEAVVQEVMPGQSQVAPRRFDGAELSRNTTYKALVTASPLQPLAVSFEGDSAALDRARQALATANVDGTPSLLVRENDRESAEYFLLADVECDRYRICRKAEAWPLAVDTPGLASAESALVILRLEHIARWVRTLELVNKNSDIAPGAVQLEIYCEQADGSLTRLDTTSGLRLEYEQRDAGWRGPKLRIRLRNTTPDRRFFCMLLDLTGTYDIYTGLLPRGGVWLEPGQSMPATVLVQGRLRETIDLYIPDELWKQGVYEVRDTLKLIVSTDEADATLLQQGDLPVTLTRPALRESLVQMNTLNRLMARVCTRNFGAAPGSDEEFADWTTVEVSSTVVRPSEAVTTV